MPGVNLVETIPDQMMVIEVETSGQRDLGSDRNEHLGLGAPLGGDFCAISLSDNLKSWTTIRRRLEAAATADQPILRKNLIERVRDWLRRAA